MKQKDKLLEEENDSVVKNDSTQRKSSFEEIEDLKDLKCGLFIGYIDDNLIFRDCEAPGIRVFRLSYERNDFQLIKTCNESVEPLLVLNETTIYYNSLQKKIIVEGRTEMELPFEYKLISICADQNFRYLAYSYFDLNNSYLKLIELNNNKTVALLKNASPHMIISNVLYYEIESEKGDGFVDIAKMDINKIGESQTILKGVYGEGLQVSSNGEYIACGISKDGDISYSIYSVRENKFHLLTDEEIKKGDYYPIFNLKDDIITFYKPNGLKIKNIPLPKKFDYFTR
jgi:hypothetical protein